MPAAFPAWTAYETSKEALGGLTRYIAVEYGPAGIRANAVEPGAIETPWNADLIARSPDPVAQRTLMDSFSPLGRMGRADEIAAVVASHRDRRPEGVLVMEDVEVRAADPGGAHRDSGLARTGQRHWHIGQGRFARPRRELAQGQHQLVGRGPAAGIGGSGRAA